MRHPNLQRVVIAVDPAVTANEESDETGIVVCGLGFDGFAYVLDDLSGQFTPNEWARRVVAAYQKYEADRVVCEVNQGGALVESVLRTVHKNISYRAIHACKGKALRAEPVAALYEQGRVFHVRCFPKLEDQMINFVPGDFDGSPDRLDALVYALTDLMVEQLPTVRRNLTNLPP